MATGSKTLKTATTLWKVAARAQDCHGQLKPSQWRIITSRHHKCWVCERHIYSLLFWNEDIGKLRNINVKNQEQFLKLIKKLPYKTRRPVVYSFESNWAGREMQTISEFCFIIDRSKPYQMLKVDLNDIKDYEFLATYEKNRMKTFNQAAYDLLKQYREPKEFRRVLKNHLDFRDAQFINCQNKCLFIMEQLYAQMQEREGKPSTK